MEDFSEYLKDKEPNKRERAKNWSAAIGLQDVDKLKTSPYLKKIAKENIEGKYSIAEAQEQIRNYYQAKDSRLEKESSEREADEASANISRILGESGFSFSIAGLCSIHRRIFEGIFEHAGTFRKYDFTKNEYVLNGETVIYSHYEDLEATLEYDFEQERNFSYAQLEKPEIIKHISHFVADFWQIHPFCEGNTRTAVVFLIKYLNSLGFEVEYNLFEKNSWYFRNALVRANYRNAAKGIETDSSYLEKFIECLLYGADDNLRKEFNNRDLLV